MPKISLRFDRKMAVAFLWSMCVLWLLAVDVHARTMHAAPKSATKLPAAATGPTSTRQTVTGSIPNSKPSDKCTPFNPSTYGYSGMDSYCAYLNTLSDKQLVEMHGAAHIPSSTDVFPIRGCTMRCILGNSFAAFIAKDPYNNLGWGGKCFNFDFNATTGVPTYLMNIFGDNYDDSKLPESKRVEGGLYCRARVSWQPVSFSDGKPAYVFDHSISEPVWAKKMKSWIDVHAFRDEMRMVKPGFLLGRIFLTTGPGAASEMPIFFALFQACAADGTFPITPAARAAPQF